MHGFMAKPRHSDREDTRQKNEQGKPNTTRKTTRKSVCFLWLFSLLVKTHGRSNETLALASDPCLSSCHESTLLPFSCVFLILIHFPRFIRRRKLQSLAQEERYLAGTNSSSRPTHVPQGQSPAQGRPSHVTLTQGQPPPQGQLAIPASPGQDTPYAFLTEHEEMVVDELHDPHDPDITGCDDNQIAKKPIVALIGQFRF